MNGLTLWKTTLSGPVRTGGKLGHASLLRLVLRPVRPDRFFVVAPVGADGSGQDTCAGSAQATRRATVVDISVPAPSSTTSGLAQPHRESSAAAAAISSPTELPFIATSAPAGATNGIDQP